MILIELSGGLGNQLFQYALGRQLALLHGTTLCYEVSALRRDALRSFALSGFRHQGQVASAQQVWQVRGLNHPFFDKKGINTALLKRSVYREQGFHFQPAVLQLPDNSFLGGYWQSERYFEAIRPTLLAELQLSDSPSHNDLQLLHHIGQKPTVALHIRRGDYLQTSTQRTHGLCSAEYYQRAQNFLAQRFEGLQLLVFTDDVAWAESSFRSPLPMRVASGNAHRPWADMWLMSQCAHHITANSTFSWWGAWLGTQPGSVVITPERWFANPQFESPHRLPERWVKI